MRRSIFALALSALFIPALAQAQAAGQPQQPTLRDQLMPSGAAIMVTAPAIASEQDKAAEEKLANQPALQRGGSGVGYMIAGLALFVAGLIIEDDDAGTVLILAGAGIGAYGLYLHFR